MILFDVQTPVLNSEIFTVLTLWTNHSHCVINLM